MFNDVRGLGIFFREEQVYFSHENFCGEREYKFVVNIELRTHEQDRFDAPFVSEVLKFNHVCDLETYKKTVKIPKWALDEDENAIHYRFDWEKLIKEVVKKEFNYIKNRLIRKFNGVIPEIVQYTATDWHKGDEFLQFTKDTAYGWAGPFKQDGKLGACAKVKKLRDTIEFPILNVELEWDYYHCPNHIQTTLDRIATSKGHIRGDYYLPVLTPEEKKELFHSFSVKDRHDIYRIYISNYSGEEWIESLLPYKIYICGNDDCSYSRYFSTEQEAIDEMNYFRIMQPLDMTRDIYDRNYIFTN